MTRRLRSRRQRAESPSTPTAPRPDLAPLRVDGWGPEPHRGVYAAVFLVSTGILTLEISFTRLFSYTVWYHFAYLTISVALMGLGSSGSLVAAFPRLFRSGGRSLVGILVAASALIILALRLLTRHPLELNDVLIAPVRFSAGLLCYYVILAGPFVLAGLALALPFSAYPHLMGRLYFCDLVGAAAGCLLVTTLVERLTVPGLIVTAAALILAGGAALALAGGGRVAGTAMLVGSLALVGSSAWIGSRLNILVTSSKHVSKVGLAASLGAGRTDYYMKWTALSRVDAFGWAEPDRNFWGGVGVAKDYAGPSPMAATITYDGGNGSNIFPFNGNFDDYAMLDAHILRTPYLLLDRPRVLVIGVGGGIDMLNAVKHGAQHVTGVELQPQTVYLLKDRLRSFTGGFYDREDVSLVADEGRHFVRQTTQRFDLIQITAVDTFAAQASGAYVLAESYLYTVEAVRDYLDHLSDDGVLAMVMGEFVWSDMLAPLTSRLTLVAERALEDAGAAHPEAHLLVVAALRSDIAIQEAVVLVKKAPFTLAELRAVEHFVEANGFTALYAPPGEGGSLPLTPLVASGPALRRDLLEKAWFRMDPVYDRSPFFYNVGKWSTFGDPFSGADVDYLHFPGSFIGQLVLVLMLVQSLVLGVVLILAPLLRARDGIRAPGLVAYLGYFLALGIGFMFIEISFVQYFVLFLGSPTYALSVTVFALLLFSGVGSLMSARWERPERALRTLAVILVALVGAYSFGLARVFDACLHLDLGWRIAVAMAAQLPMGLVLGHFMPLGIACVREEHPRLVPWAWGVNGIGSVVGTTLAVILAMAWSFTLVSLLACVLYVGGTLALCARPRV